MWPGGSAAVGTINAVTIGWDTDNPPDGVADAFRSYPAEGVLGSDSGTPKIAFTTPAGWRLETGTSQITGTTPQNEFVLTHTCAGTPTTTTTTTTTSTTSTTGTTPGTPGTSPSTPGLPVTGAAIGGLVATGLALVVGGAALMLARRRRDAETATEIAE